MRNRWFASLPESLQEDLLCDLSTHMVDKGEYLFRKGDRLNTSGYGFCVLVQGRLKVSALHPSGKEFVLTILEPGHWFGEVQILLDINHTHDVSTLEKCTVLSVPRRRFGKLLSSVEFSNSMLSQSAFRMRQLFSLVEDTHLLSQREFVATRLYYLARGDMYQLTTPRSVVSVSHEILSMMCGMTRQSLAKELNFLTQENVIATRYGYIDILDLDKLAHIAFSEHSTRREGREDHTKHVKFAGLLT